MTRRYVADDQYGQLWRRLGEIARRVDEGSIPFDTTMRSLQLVVERDLAASTNPTYLVTVNYDLSLAEMIKVGKYDSVNSGITKKHFPVNGEGTNEVVTELVHFNRFIGSDEVIRELDKRGFRPATIEELLAFGAKYPEMQIQFPIVALGSLWRHLGHRDVPYLWGASRGHDLNLDWFENGWEGHYRFLAVRK